MFHGMCLFVLGLLTGFPEQHFANVRMGLAAHLEGLMNGTFLIALGAIWTHVRFAPVTKTIAFWTGLYGAYVNWLITLLAAASVLEPCRQLLRLAAPVSPGRRRYARGFMSVGVMILASSVLALVGLRGRAPAR